MLVPQAPIPSGQWENSQVTQANAFIVLQGEKPGWRESEYFIIVKAYCNLREALCSFYWTVSKPVLCANGDNISTSQDCLQTSLLLYRETVPSKSLHCTNIPKYSLQNRQLALFFSSGVQKCERPIKIFLPIIIHRI